MAVSIARVLIGGVVAAAGTTAAIACAALGLFDAGAPAAAERLGIAPPMAAISPLLVTATLTPRAISPAQRAAARAAIRRRPLAALPYFVLGASIAASGDNRVGGALVDVALSHDPRLAAALLWRTRRGIATGDYVAATDHALRLLSIKPQEKAPLDLLVLLSGMPAARPRILAAVARTPDWRSGYLGALSASTVSRSFLYQALQTGSPVTVNLTSERTTFLSGLIRRGEYDRAYTAWVSWLPDKALSAIAYLYDGEFRGMPGVAPFNWQLSTAPNGFASIEPGRGLALTFDGATETVLAGQMMLLQPGRYRIVTAMDKADAGQADTIPGLFWRLGCVGTTTMLPDSPVRLARAPVRAAGGVFEIKPDCPAQLLELRVTPQVYPAQTSTAMRSVAIEAVP